MRCEGLADDVYGDYVLGTIAAPDLQELNSHLAGDCSRCESEIAAMRGLWYGVALAAPPAEPPRALRKRVVASVRLPSRSPSFFAWWQWLAAPAAVSLALFVGWRIGQSQSVRAPAPVVQTLPNGSALSALEKENQALREQLAGTAKAPVANTPPAAPARVVVPQPVDNPALLAQLAEQRNQVAQAQRDLARQKDLLAQAERERADLSRRYQAVMAQPRQDAAAVQRQLAAAQVRAQQLEHDVAEYRALLVQARQRLAPVQTASSLLADPNLRLVRLRATGRNSAIQGHALVSSGSEVLFYGSQMPALPAGRTYQLWLIRGTAPAIVSAGVFQPGPQRRAVVRFDTGRLTSGITAIAVTDEPAGGSSTPTGHKLLIGS